MAGGSGAVHRQLGVVATSWGAGCAMVAHQTNHVSEIKQRLVKQIHSGSLLPSNGLMKLKIEVK